MMRWAIKEKEIKANEKNRKKASTHLRRSGSKRKIKINETPRGKQEGYQKGVFGMTRVFRHLGVRNNLTDSLFGAVDAIHDPGR